MPAGIVQQERGHALNKIFTAEELAPGTGEPDRLDQMLELQLQHLELSQTIDAKLTLLLEILAPKESDGPTLDDIIARLVEMVSEQRPYLRRLDTTTGRSLDILEKLAVRPHEAKDKPA